MSIYRDSLFANNLTVIASSLLLRRKSDVSKCPPSRLRGLLQLLLIYQKPFPTASLQPPPVSAKPATWMQSALMWADMFIKLGLVSGCSEYCRRQSRPCGARGESARDEGRDRERESAGERLALWRLIWTLPYSAVLLFSSTKLSDTKGFCSCICFALRVVLEQSTPQHTQTFVVQLLIQHRTPLILFGKQVALVNSFRSFDSRWLCSRCASRWSASSQLEQRHLLSGSLSLLHHCTNTHTQNNFKILSDNNFKLSHALKSVIKTNSLLLYSHNNLLFEERTIKGEGFIFTSFSTNMDSIFLGKLISANKKNLLILAFHLNSIKVILCSFMLLKRLNVQFKAYPTNLTPVSEKMPKAVPTLW